MELAHSAIRQKYIEQMKSLEADIERATSGDVDHESLAEAQNQLDLLAKIYQNNEKIGTVIYKLYELQALIHYFNNDDTRALEFIDEATRLRGKDYARADKLKQEIANSQAQSVADQIIFFHRSPATVFILTLLTLNFYTTYWSYKHWHYIQKSTGERVHPILSAIFQVFTIAPLFKKIKTAANTDGYTKFRHYGWAAAGCIISLIIGNGVWRATIHSTSEAVTAIVVSVVFTVFVGIILSVTQRAANAHDDVVFGPGHNYRKAYVGEVIFVIIGILIVLAVVGGIIVEASNGSRGGLSPQAEAAYQKVQSLKSQYKACSSDLSSRRSSVDANNSYEVETYNNDYQACENIRQQANQAVDNYNTLAGYN